MFASDFKVLTHGVVFLLVQVCLHHDVDVIVSAPKPVKSAPTKSGDVGYMELHTVLCVPGLFRRCAVHGWFVVWSFWLWQSPLDLSRRDKCRCFDSPDLNYLAGKLGRQKGKYSWMAPVISNPHQIPVD